MKYLMMVPIILMISCSTAKRGERQIDKGIKNNRPYFAEQCAINYPVQYTAADTIVKTEYDFLEIVCPGMDTITERDTIYQLRPQTSYLIQRPTIVRTEDKIKYITVKVKDSATAYLLNDVNKKYEVIKYHAGKLTKWMIWLLVLLVLSLFGNIYQITRK
jgi:hypothetical protein